MRRDIVGRWLARYMLFPACFYLSMLSMFSSVDGFIETGGTSTIGKGFSISSSDKQTLVSPGGRFELGFFHPETRSIPGLFLGIWYYNFDPRTVVWVANRDIPVYGLGYFGISEDGNLVVRDGEGSSSPVCFSTSLDRSLFNRTAILLDTGNLVLREDGSGKNLWESFFHPTDMFLPGMKMSATLKLGSWKSQDDPAPGNYVFKLDDEGSPIILNGSVTQWVSRESSKFIGSQLNPTASLLLSNFRNLRKAAFKKTISVNRDYNYTRLVLNSSGQFQLWDVTSVGKKWDLIWSAPADECEIYMFCGNFGSCDSSNSVSKCKCLPGFEPIVPNVFSNGCNRKSVCTENDTFLNLTMMKVNDPDPNFDGAGLNSSECIEKCRESCHCLAYSYVNNWERGQPQCWIWTSELYDLEEANGNNGRNLHVRVAPSDIRPNGPLETGPNLNPSNAGKSKKFSDRILAAFVKAVIAIAVIILVILVGGIGFYFYKRRTRTHRRESRESVQSNPAIHLYDTERRVKTLIDSGEFKEDDKKGIGVPFFELESIIEATDGFSDANKLGEGGFGPVYKGNFFEGQEMAVKRLSSHSGQGLEEFKNEVILIAKLQHRNLVRLLGHCVKGNEKILLYEYMPNRSLDAFIFDRTLCMLLDWEKRFDIILGVARGLLYLHQDSRLRIIHRDLKTSNILLDKEMNPKISDFGLARIVGGKETEANTTRVVGTYGYMAPEYALDGLFSTKSDVFSFGVILLELVSGKRNTGFYRSQQALNLLGYAWGLWREEKPLDLMDQAILKSCNRDEVMRCITVGLLCVQEDPSDRPNMSNVLFMLGSEAATLPTPKEPAFVAKKWIGAASSSSSSKPESYSNVELTVSCEGR